MIELVYVATSDRLDQTLASAKSVIRHPPFPDRIKIITDDEDTAKFSGFPVPILFEKLKPVVDDFPLGNKIQAFDSVADHVIYLDNDTFANQSICDLVMSDAGAWDVRARVASIFVNGNISIPSWDTFFAAHGLSPVPMWNTGVICVKRGQRRELESGWRKWFKELSRTDYSHICLPFAMDQFALSLAIAEINFSVSCLNSLEHSFEWEHEDPFRSIIHHTSSNFYRRSLLRRRLVDAPGCRNIAPMILIGMEKVARKVTTALRG